VEKGMKPEVWKHEQSRNQAERAETQKRLGSCSWQLCNLWLKLCNKINGSSAAARRSRRRSALLASQYRPKASGSARRRRRRRRKRGGVAQNAAEAS